NGFDIDTRVGGRGPRAQLFARSRRNRGRDHHAPLARAGGFPLVVMPAIALFTVAVAYANPRFRASAETLLAILTAGALAALWRRLVRTNMSGAQPSLADDDAAVLV